MYSGMHFGVRLEVGGEEGPSVAAESGSVLSDIWQGSAGRLCRWTQAPMCLNHRRIRP